jgi:hypothetical protein
MAAGSDPFWPPGCIVVAGVDDDRAVVGDVDVGGLVLEAAQRGVLDGHRVGIPRVEFDDVSEPVRLVGAIGEVEAGIEGLPQPLEAFALTHRVVAPRPGATIEPLRVWNTPRRNDSRSRCGAATTVTSSIA